MKYKIVAEKPLPLLLSLKYIKSLIAYTLSSQQENGP